MLLLIRGRRAGCRWAFPLLLILAALTFAVDLAGAQLPSADRFGEVAETVMADSAFSAQGDLAAAVSADRTCQSGAGQAEPPCQLDKATGAAPAGMPGAARRCFARTQGPPLYGRAVGLLDRPPNRLSV